MRKLHIVSGTLLAMAIASHPPMSSDYVPQVTYIVSCDVPCSDYEDPDVFKFDVSLLDGEYSELRSAWKRPTEDAIHILMKGIDGPWTTTATEVLPRW